MQAGNDIAAMGTAERARTDAGIDPRYYQEGERWEKSVYRSVAASRGVWRTVAVLLAAALIAMVGLLWATLPLRTFDVVVLEVDRTTGYVEASRPLREAGNLTQNEAVTRANIVRFLRARETYDPKSLRDNFDLASLYSTGKAADDLANTFSGANPNNPVKLYGADTIVSVAVKSIIFLNEQTAAVRFSTTRTSRGASTETRHWVANVRFRYTSEPMRNDWRFDNPLGFQVTEYRRDQETVITGESQ
ncbi:UNVERIFIED_ORG: type IV secretion system protein VirB8 [Agrobacterium larrymoorei]|uniref:Type IV secretion system protein virB8 n=2 Tax=Rhizobium/Agrobacterium group TaxID=227290 RepID=A0AA92BZ15_RHIRH|nr:MULTISPECIES: type IV secretion system protein [Rhizobium/Agrobacterium group]MDP9573831.1 type IV secretion system protein VirB8 [Agrobacterium larrymoorei]PVE62581.1 type VI secretion protein [Agrobacterium tumefaciens]PVE70719.1 type VI secretion protein [Sphingomonas sp. TPD3009]PVE50158.1 type VI secretion protein [Rhizobium rhizogenes]TBN14819.1 type VI secretion protein [Agrobacterium cavarae]